MTNLLPTVRFTATGTSMRAKLTSLFVMLAILFGGIVVPATAHAQDLVASHGSEMFAALEHVDDTDHGDRHKQAGDEPCHVLSHHHCSTALGVDGPSLTLSVALRDANALPLAVTAMSSLSQAPPIEPPAA